MRVNYGKFENVYIHRNDVYFHRRIYFIFFIKLETPMRKLIIMVMLAVTLANCSTSSTTRCNGKSYRAGAGEMSIWCMWR